jgi:hypothetical protein
MLEDVSFEGSGPEEEDVKVDAAYVRKQLADIVKDQDLSRYINCLPNHHHSSSTRSSPAPVHLA